MRIIEKISLLQSQEEESKKELGKFLRNISLHYKIRYIGYSIALFYYFIREWTGVSLAPTLLITIFILGLLLVLSGISDLLLKKTRLKEEVARAHTFYFIFHAAELSLILILLHIGGNIHFIGAIGLTAFLLTSHFSYTRKNYRFAIIFFGIAVYTAIVSLEYAGILEARDVYNLGVNVAENFNVFFVTITTGIPIMIMAVLIVSIFASRLENSLKTLAQKETELQKEKISLGIKVRARTKELLEERESLERKVQERTKELEEERKRLAKKLSELEKFHKAAVGRELKMRELKKEIEKIKRLKE